MPKTTLKLSESIAKTLKVYTVQIKNHACYGVKIEG